MYRISHIEENIHKPKSITQMKIQSKALSDLRTMSYTTNKLNVKHEPCFYGKVLHFNIGPPQQAFTFELKQHAQTPLRMS